MNKSVIVVISVLILVSLTIIEARPRNKAWHKHLSQQEDSESVSVKSCTNCIYRSIGNGEKNHNIIHYGSKPKSESENTETNNKFDETSESDEDETTCHGCIVSKIGIGYKNYNEIFYD